MAADDPVSSRELREPKADPPRGSAWLIRLQSTEFALPGECACCGTPAARELRASDGQQAELLVGYCEPCASHVARDATRRLSALLSSLLVGLALAAALPIVFPWLPLALCVALAWLGALLPLWLGRLGGQRAPGHASVARAAFFRAPGELVCLRGAYAAAVARAAGTRVLPTRQPRLRAFFPAALVSALTLLVAPLSYGFHHPTLRVLDLGALPMDLFVDGRHVARVEPSSGESPLAGTELRLPAGSRELRAVDTEGALMGQARVDVQAGRRHLYAPGASGVCFWLEAVSYGRDGKRPDFTPLDSEKRFWVVPEQVTGWFMPSPPVAEGARATGGSSTVLRQGPCDDAPFAR
jgi:hypothetical protein